MSLSSEALLDHIADFLEFISSAQSFWFLLNTSYDHGCHLASVWTPMSTRRFSSLPAWSYTRFGFQIKAGAWSKFLGGGGDANIKINHGCGGGDCGGSGNSDGNSDGGGGGGGGSGGDGSNGGGRESDGSVGGKGDDSDER